MAYNAPVLSLTLTAGVVNLIVHSASLGAAGNFTLTSSPVTLSVARRVLFTFAGDETGHNFTVTGTDRYGRVQSEVVAGNNTTAYTSKDFLTVTQVSVNAATTSTVQVGTNTIGSTAPYIMDTFINPPNIGAGLEFVGTVTTSLEVSMTDLTPAWDLNANSPVWYSATNFTGLSTNSYGSVGGPFTMIRLTNSSGTGTATARLVVPFIAGA